MCRSSSPFLEHLRLEHEAIAALKSCRHRFRPSWSPRTQPSLNAPGQIGGVFRRVVGCIQCLTL